MGIINPITDAPGKTKGEITICGIKTVNRYKINAFTIKENAPNVSIFKGSVNMVSIGRTKMDIRERVNPPISSICIPPTMRTPEISCDTIYRENALIAVFRRIVFIGKWFFDASRYSHMCQRNSKILSILQYFDLVSMIDAL